MRSYTSLLNSPQNFSNLPWLSTARHKSPNPSAWHSRPCMIWLLLKIYFLSWAHIGHSSHIKLPFLRPYGRLPYWSKYALPFSVGGLPIPNPLMSNLARWCTFPNESGRDICLFGAVHGSTISPLCHQQWTHNLSEKYTLTDFPGGPMVKSPLPMQGTGVRSLVWENPTCHGATQPVHNYWSPCLEPVLHNNRSHFNEKPAHHNQEQPSLTTTRESPRAGKKTQCCQK